MEELRKKSKCIDEPYIVKLPQVKLCLNWEVNTKFHCLSDVVEESIVDPPLKDWL